MTTNERVTWLVSGIVVGAIIIGLWQPNHATAQSAQSGAWQLGVSASTNTTVWRLNTLTGALEACSFIPRANCEAMPAPGH